MRILQFQIKTRRDDKRGNKEKTDVKKKNKKKMMEAVEKTINRKMFAGDFTRMKNK